MSGLVGIVPRSVLVATDTWVGDEGDEFDDEDLHPWIGTTETATNRMMARTSKAAVVRRITLLSETEGGWKAWLAWSSVNFRNLILAGFPVLVDYSWIVGATRRIFGKQQARVVICRRWPMVSSYKPLAL